MPAKPAQPDRAMLMDQLNWDDVTDQNLNFLKAIGVECIRVATPASVSDGHDHTDEFVRIRRFVEEHGIQLIALHGGPRKEDIVYGREGRDAQLETWIKVVRAIGAAGVPMTGLTFQPIGHFRTRSTRGRGGAMLSTFDFADYKARPRQYSRADSDQPQDFAGRELSEERLWESAEWFFKRIVPVAEEAGVRIALHPDDPPIPDPLGGAARIVTSLENYDRIYNIAPSTSNAMLFCQGCFAEMGEDIYEAIAYASSAGRICYVHFRDIVGTPYNFQEVFIDEGQNDMLKAMQTYKENGFAGPFMMDHTPRMPDGFNAWHGHAYANGYIKSLIQTVFGKAPRS
ncbi:MAG TPA: mannonate dehydratase [Chloroflexota bacterium]|jgi:mannonate dehydratase|nr:mannonate dehydratase [Chloroflexota bacterium]